MQKYFTNLHKDIPAGLVVFLVALPLCLGIALASGAPMVSGLLAGIVGGIVIGFLSDSHTSVSGPAAGLTAVVLASITTLVTFENFLLAVFLAGAIQLIGGIFKTGFIADYIPSNVIKGLLAAIGIILILKQIPHAVGYDNDVEGDFSFLQVDGKNTFTALLGIFDNFTIASIIVSAASFTLIILWEKVTNRYIKLIPASLLVVIIGVLVNLIIAAYFPVYAFTSEHLVNIPAFTGFQDLVTFPNFNEFSNPKVWTVALTLALVASLETLLNLEAVQNLDPHKRIASPNRELFAQGIGNMVCGLIGGLPVTSVIVRSSVNIYAGAETKVSAILHGFLLISSVLFLSPLINQIPLASLAVILIFTGYKLAKISLFKEMYRKGLNQFIPFVSTIGFIVFFDLLTGVIIGLIISIFYILKSNFRRPFESGENNVASGKVLNINLSNQVTFLNKARLKQMLWSIQPGTNVTINASESDFIDNDIFEMINDFRRTYSKENNIGLNLVGFKKEYDLHDNVEFVQVLNKQSREKLSPEMIVQFLKDGNHRFTSGKTMNKYYQNQINDTAQEQSPMALVLACIDSRVAPEIIFDTSIGEIMSIRIAGNIVNKDTVDSIEMACQKIGVKVVVCLGHSNCGAVQLAMDQHHIPSQQKNNILNTIDRAILRVPKAATTGNSNQHEIMNEVICGNAKLSSADLISQSEWLQSNAKNGSIKIISAYYDTHTGMVKFLES